MKRMLFVVVFIIPLLAFAHQEKVGYLGVSTESLSEPMKIALGLEYGVLIEEVAKDSPADKAGIEIGDIILEIDKNKIDDYKTLKNVVEERPNKKVELVINRKGKKMTKMAMFGESEKSKIKFEIDIPKIPDLKVILEAKQELQKEIEELKEELKQLKEELDQIKEKLK